MKKLFTDNEADNTIKEFNKIMIGKKYILANECIIVIELVKEKVVYGMFKIWVITNSLCSDELYKVLRDWPIDLESL